MALSPAFLPAFSLLHGAASFNSFAVFVYEWSMHIDASLRTELVHFIATLRERLQRYSPMLQFLIGVLANGIIVVVNGTELTKQRKMIPLALLLSCLGISRICLQSVIYINRANVSLIEVPLLVENFVIFMFVNELGLWFASWLCVFYCARIAPVAHPLFFWLKMRISKLVPWLILRSLLYASIPSIFYNKYTWVLSQQLLLGFFSSNATTQIKETSALQIVFLVRLLSPLFISLASALLLMFSLGRHTWQMRNAAMGTRVPSTAVHIFKLRSLMFLFCIWAFGSYPSGHSMILILGNPKLKQNARKLLLHGKCCQIKYWLCLRCDVDIWLHICDIWIYFIILAGGQELGSTPANHSGFVLLHTQISQLWSEGCFSEDTFKSLDSPEPP
ncbi:hypothetical protein GH733_004678 [Mirounga leonina]|nr:hypothetical protein GH733_004678 [Mirounga leonina]